MRFLLLAFLLIPVPTPLFAVDGILLHRKSIVRFATNQEGKDILAKDDAFISRLSHFDRQSRMKTNDEVTNDDFIKFITREIVEWEKDEMDKVSVAVNSIRKKMDAFQIPFPKTILLIKTTGKEEGEAAYCRSHAVVLPQKVLGRPPDSLERLLIHELFHILSRHDTELRTKLYAIVGFHPCDEIKLPKSLRDRRITNPDAPSIDYYIELKVKGMLTKAVPVLYSSAKEYDAKQGGSFFKYLLFRMMIVKKNGDQWSAVERDGRPIVFDPMKLPAYFEKIGNNTGYIIHPDEILADNFVHLVRRTEDLKTPRIVDEMSKLLAK